MRFGLVNDWFDSDTLMFPGLSSGAHQEVHYESDKPQIKSSGPIPNEETNIVEDIFIVDINELKMEISGKSPI